MKLLVSVFLVSLAVVSVFGNRLTSKHTRAPRTTPAPIIDQFIVTKVADGDTITVKHAKNGTIERVRFQCIDAPEKSQAPWGDVALKELIKLLPLNSQVTLKITARDMYGRTIAEVMNHKGVNVNKKLVETGHCVLYPFQKGCDDYKKLEEVAKKAKKGVWSDKSFIMPWDFRKNHGIGARGQAAAAKNATATTATTTTATATTTAKKSHKKDKTN